MQSIGPPALYVAVALLFLLPDTRSRHWGRHSRSISHFHPLLNKGENERSEM